LTKKKHNTVERNSKTLQNILEKNGGAIQQLQSNSHMEGGTKEPAAEFAKRISLAVLDHHKLPPDFRSTQQQLQQCLNEPHYT
jgi:hypothetical protein